MTGDELTRLFQPWENTRAILLAISGGPDSMALLHLAARWAQMPGRPKLLAATVDHGLRPEGKAEARLVAQAARQLKIPHKTLLWLGEKPTTGIQEKARDARYTLLAAHAAKAGADVLMTAHHADDQAETILFRLLRGSGIAGLSGMKDEASRNGVKLARPLLGLRKAELIKICEAVGQSCVDDPSNSNARYARTGLRSFLAGLESHGLTAPDFTRLGKRLARADAALASVARKAEEDARQPGPAGEPAHSMTRLLDVPDEIQIRVIALVMEKAGAKSPISLEKLESLHMKLQKAAKTGVSCAGTLAGLRISLDKKGLLKLSGEGLRKRGLAK